MNDFPRVLHILAASLISFAASFRDRLVSVRRLGRKPHRIRIGDTQRTRQYFNEAIHIAAAFAVVTFGMATTSTARAQDWAADPSGPRLARGVTTVFWRLRMSARHNDRKTQRQVIQGWLAALIVATMPMPLAWAQSGWQSDPMGPRQARGLSTQFGTFGAEDIDTINHFNGSVNLSIPIGQSYPAGGTLSYGLVAQYNSNDFDVRESLLQEDPPGSQPVPFNVNVPNALSNAGRGWSLHLGRLFEYGDGAENESLPQIEREHLPIIAPALPLIDKGWLYASTDGSTHRFTPTLNNESVNHPDVYYTRDGSYLRLKRYAANSANCPAPQGSGILACATIEMPDGQVHFFERKLAWPDWPLNRDKWRLRKIYDQTGSQGAPANIISINYFPDRWEIDDQFSNTLRGVIKIFWEADHNGDPSKSWFYGRIRKIELPKFGGGVPAEYQFIYEQLPFNRLANDGINFETRYAGYLKQIVRPDQAAYTFTEVVNLLDPIRTLTAELPTAGKIEWVFDRIFLPYEGLCKGGSSAGPAQIYVDKRTVKDVDGDVLKTTQYLRNVNYSPLVPGDYCPPNNGEPAKRTESELIVGEFQKYASGKGRMQLRYFSIFPLWGDNLGNGTAGGWTSREFGKPFTRDESNNGLHLSTRLFDCPFESVSTYQPNGFRTDIDVLMAGCSRLRSTYIAYEGYGVVPGCPFGIGICDFESWEYLIPNPMVKESTTVFHDDSNKSITDKYTENDGFSHFRTHKMTGNISPRHARNQNVLQRRQRRVETWSERRDSGRLDLDQQSA